MMVSSDFRPEVDMQLFRACAMKNMQYNRYLMPESLRFPRLVINHGHPSVDRSTMKLLSFIRTVRSCWTCL